MKGFDPKWVFYLGIAVTIETAIGQGSVSLTNVVPASWAPYIVGWCSLLAFIGTAVMTALSGYSSARPGPLTDFPAAAVSPAVKAAMILAVLILGTLIVPTPGHAQLKRPAITGNLAADIATDLKGGTTAKPSIAGVTLTGDLSKDGPKIWAQIIAASGTDLTYASAMAASAGTPASKTRQQCWDAIVTINKQASGSALKNADGTPMARPDKHFFTDVESLAEVIDNLSPQGTLYTSCAGAAKLAGMNVTQFISAAVAGVATFAATGLAAP